ncbi:hypothetical protein Scep_022911 [Stephania cephalantha]|uniref:Uncharacterized protein n=1 Tax=Stephania cephalantha TaxID=152367 RepID=A0AAP0FCT2_9MAGN
MVPDSMDSSTCGPSMDSSSSPVGGGGMDTAPPKMQHVLALPVPSLSSPRAGRVGRYNPRPRRDDGTKPNTSLAFFGRNRVHSPPCTRTRAPRDTSTECRTPALFEIADIIDLANSLSLSLNRKTEANTRAHRPGTNRADHRLVPVRRARVFTLECASSSLGVRGLFTRSTTAASQ